MVVALLTATRYQTKDIYSGMQSCIMITGLIAGSFIFILPSRECRRISAQDSAYAPTRYSTASEDELSLCHWYLVL